MEKSISMSVVATAQRSGSNSSFLPPSGPPLKKSQSAPLSHEESFVQRFVPDMVVERLCNGGSIQSQELSRVSYCCNVHSARVVANMCNLSCSTMKR